MAVFQSIKLNVLCGLMALGLLSASASAIPMKTTVGIGPMFANQAFGYVGAATDFRLAQWGDFSLYAGPWAGFYFGKHLIGGDLNGFLKGYYHIQLNNRFSLGITAKLPLGLTLANVDYILGKQFYMGFNIGLIPGVEFHFHKNFGVFADIGFFHHSFFPTNKLALNLHEPMGFFMAGAIFKF